MKSLLSLTFLAFLSLSPVQAADLMMSDVWARATPKMAKAGAAFLTIQNHSAEDDRLIAASADVSRKTEIHTHIHADGIMKMRKVEALPLPAQGQLALKPGGDHIMFMGLKAPLIEGDSFPLTLFFEKAGAKTVTVKIQSLKDKHHHTHKHTH